MPTPSVRPRWMLAFGLASCLVAARPAGVAAQSAKPAPKAAASKLSDLSRFAPRERLIALIEFDGLDAHNAAWRRTGLAKLLYETKLGAMAEDLLAQAITQGLAKVEGDKPTAAEIIKLAKEVIADGMMLAVWGGEDPDKPQVIVVFRDGDRNGLRAMFERLDNAGKDKPTVEERGARTLHLSGTGAGRGGWWAEGRDLATGPAKAIDAVLAVLDGKAPAATAHPIRAELARPPDAGVETALSMFVDFASIPASPEAARLGFDGLKRVDYRWGFQGEMLYSALNVAAPAPRRGVLAVVDGKVFPRFDKATLPSVPVGANQWATLSLDPVALWGWVAGQLPPGPDGEPAMIKFEKAVPQLLGGLRLREDILATLGPKWTVYLDASGLNLARGAKAKAALTVELREPAAAATAIARVMDVATQILRSQPAQPGRGKPEIVKLPGNAPAWKLVLPPGMAPPTLPDLAPTLVLGKKRLAIGFEEAEARTATTASDRWKPTPDFAPAIARLPDNLVSLTVLDPRVTLPQQITQIPVLLGAMNMAMMAQAKGGPPPFTIKADPAKVPSAEEIRSRLTPGTVAVSIDAQGLKVVSRQSTPTLSSPAASSVAVALLLPAVQAAREAARRSQSVNNLKVIGLAMHGYHNDNNAFPPAAIAGKDGKPLLSWRVAILPYIDQADLYKEFRLDEPWDSEHNKALIPRMPRTYLNPSTGSPKPGETHYLAFVGPHAALDLKPTKIDQFTDGTSYTVMVADSTRGVPWTKPEDTPFDPKAAPSLLGAGSPHPGGFNALLADGSVRFLKNIINPKTFWSLLSRDGGEVIKPGDL